MKKIYSLILAAALSIGGITGVAQAATFDLGQLTVSEGGTGFFNGTFDGTDTDYIPYAATNPFVDEYLFTVDVLADFASTATTITVSANSIFTSFNTALYVYEDGWTSLASNIGTYTLTPGIPSAGSWSSILTYSPLNPDPTQYKLVVFGAKDEGNALYAGGISVAAVTPVPEPEIYAMMAAGLGLMGFVARRRQRNGAVS